MINQILTLSLPQFPMYEMRKMILPFFCFLSALSILVPNSLEHGLSLTFCIRTMRPQAQLGNIMNDK